MAHEPLCVSLFLCALLLRVSFPAVVLALIVLILKSRPSWSEGISSLSRARARCVASIAYN